VTWESASSLQAPAGALFRQGAEWRAFVVEGGRVALRTVKPGRSNGVQTEIVEGLREGEQVVVYPGDKVRSGARVRPLVVAGS
jgi:HlyD family secretion protein